MSDLTRRDALKLLAAAGVAATGCADKRRADDARTSGRASEPADPSTILASEQLGFNWSTVDPFLFCVHHNDHYPAGTDQMGVTDDHLVGRRLGRDFTLRDGWRMYHGKRVPGFPQHPHRGFETITVVRRGLLDHSDSLGAAARYGGGDVQWLTAGAGILHSEMFPLLRSDADNPLELFQIWLNLPSRNKMVAPHFSMLWNHTIPRLVERDRRGRETTVAVIAGAVADKRAPAPPPNSWAADADAHVAVWTVKMQPGATWMMPAAPKGVNRTLYFFRGSRMNIAGVDVASYRQVRVRPDVDTPLVAGPDESELLVLQGRPIGEPVVRRGPFVMNSQHEIRQAFQDYRRTRFGGWPWASNEPVHPRTEGRFARGIDGVIERPT